MQFVIHRGALVTFIQVLLLITFYALPTQLTWHVFCCIFLTMALTSPSRHFRFAFHVNVTKLYANTFCEYAPTA
jgi:hypothetical protein